MDNLTRDLIAFIKRANGIPEQECLGDYIQEGKKLISIRKFLEHKIQEDYYHSCEDNRRTSETIFLIAISDFLKKWD